MWALIAFIGLGVLVAALIEINERIKAKKAKGERQDAKEACLKPEVRAEDCSACELISVCEKEEKNKKKA
jgi:hypothetical protein